MKNKTVYFIDKCEGKKSLRIGYIKEFDSNTDTAIITTGNKSYKLHKSLVFSCIETALKHLKHF